jgi:starch-binding outer membrane protein, SusD/RagB family
MRMMRRCAVATATAALGSLGACSLDLNNPNSPTEDQVTSSVDAVIGLATGLQGRFAQSYGNFAYMAGLVTDEFSATSAALISISDAEQGAVPSGTGIAENVFTSVYRTVRTADELLSGSEALSGEIAPGTLSGLRALAFTLKAEALGEALQSYQKIPIKVFNVAAPTYVPRSEALPYVRALLDSALAEITAVPASATFNNTILTPGVNLTNVIHLFRARYARMANDDATALAASNLVGRTGATGALSVLTFPAPTVNFYANVTGGTQGIAVRRQWRTSMLPQDQRFTYFVTPSTTLTGRIGSPLDPWNRYASPQAPLPVYMPDEALLIKAEALANQNSLADGLRGRSRHRRPEGVFAGIDGAAHEGSAARGDLSAAQVRAARHGFALGGQPSPQRDKRAGRGAVHSGDRPAVLVAVRHRGSQRQP